MQQPWTRTFSAASGFGAKKASSALRNTFTKAEDEASDEENVSTVGFAQANAKYVIDWTSEEMDNVTKFYGLDSLFPNKWTEESTFGTVEIQVDQSDFLANKTGLGGDVNKSDPLGIKDNIMKRPKGSPKIADPRRILVGDRNFDPKTFLLEVHCQTDFKTLEKGAAKLKKTISERKENDRGEVKKHFAKFVSAKSTVDLFYDEMKSKNLISRSDFGIMPFKAVVDKLDRRSKTLYEPVLQRREKANKIRAALSILGQWRFFFNLSTSLQDQIRKFEAAVRDYKKGRYLMESSFSNSSENDHKLELAYQEENTFLPKSYQNVFEKLWEAVEVVIASFRVELFQILSEAAVSPEKQEKIISHLTELDAKSDPLWFYLHSQYQTILEKLLHIYNEHTEILSSIKVQTNEFKKPNFVHGESSENLRSTEELNTSTNDLAAMEEFGYERRRSILPSTGWSLEQTKTALKLLKSDLFDQEFGDEIHVVTWYNILHFVSEIFGSLDTELPRFWRTCKMFIDRKGTRDHPGKTKSEEKGERKSKCDTMFKNLLSVLDLMVGSVLGIELKAEIIMKNRESMKEPFSETMESFPKVLIISSENEEIQEKDSFETQLEEPYQRVLATMNQFKFHEDANHLEAHPLVIVRYATQIVNVLRNCHADIKPFHSEYGMTALSSLENTISEIQIHLVKIICDGWVDLSSNLFMHEDWNFENVLSIARKKVEATTLVHFYSKLSTFIVKAIALILTESNDQNSLVINNYSVETLKSSLFQSLFSMIDGFEWQLSQWANFNQIENEIAYPTAIHPKLKAVFPDNKNLFGHFVPSNCVNIVDIAKAKDIKNIDIRELIILSNLIYVKDGVAENLQGILTSKFDMDLTFDATYFDSSCENMDHFISYNFIKRNGESIKKYIRNAIFYSGLDWSCLARPIEVRPYCFHILQEFVYVHAIINDVSKSLTSKLMSLMVEMMASELLMSFRKLDQLNVPGMLQLTLEAEFLDTSLNNYKSEISQQMFKQLYETLERSSKGSENPEDMASYLQSTKTFLREARTTTITQYRCLGNAKGL